MSDARRKLAVVGWPVTHSRSPLIHNHWIEAAALDAHYEIYPIDPAADFRAELEKMAAQGYVGANVTVPHKEAAFAAMDRLSDAAKALGAVNTIRFENGQFVGDNTDGDGFLAALDTAHAGAAWRAQPVLVLGAGGAARAIVAALTRAQISDIRLTNRTSAKAEALRDLNENLRIEDWSRRGDAAAGCGLLVNTTSLGMQGQPPLDMPLDGLRPDALVCDIVYAPLKTPLLVAAEKAGYQPVDGLGMLMHQAALSFEIWFGRKPSVNAALRNLLLADLEADNDAGKTG